VSIQNFSGFHNSECKKINTVQVHFRVFKNNRDNLVFKKHYGVQKEKCRCKRNCLILKLEDNCFRTISIIGEKTKILLKNGVHIKLHSGLLFPELNNLFRINFSEMYYFLILDFFIWNEILIFFFQMFISRTQKISFKSIFP